FKSLPLIGTALLAAGVVILLAGWREGRNEKQPLTWRPALWVGLIQGVCLPFRGFSRSGATISTGLFCGLSRSLAEEFSFALAVAITPPAIIREVYRLLKDKDKGWQGSSELFQLLLPGVVGMGFSFVAGLLALK